MVNSAENLWRTGEFARKSKVTVQTLRYHDRLGLSKPKHYDRKGFRLYGRGEFARLRRITTLRFNRKIESSSARTSSQSFC